MQVYKRNKPPTTDQSDYSISVKYGIMCLRNLAECIPMGVHNKTWLFKKPPFYSTNDVLTPERHFAFYMYTCNSDCCNAHLSL